MAPPPFAPIVESAPRAPVEAPEPVAAKPAEEPAAAPPPAEPQTPPRGDVDPFADLDALEAEMSRLLGREPK